MNTTDIEKYLPDIKKIALVCLNKAKSKYLSHLLPEQNDLVQDVITSILQYGNLDFNKPSWKKYVYVIASNIINRELRKNANHMSLNYLNNRLALIDVFYEDVSEEEKTTIVKKIFENLESSHNTFRERPRVPKRFEELYNQAVEKGAVEVKDFNVTFQTIRVYTYLLNSYTRNTVVAKQIDNKIMLICKYKK
jgi:DNA-directed RNA polymerase specialized sigma24 family protein